MSVAGGGHDVSGVDGGRIACRGLVARRGRVRVRGLRGRFAGGQRAGRPGAGRGERGATVIELALIMPVVLVVILLIVQFALVFHGRQVADAAAREGARIARGAGTGSSGWQGSAEARARGIVKTIGPKMLQRVAVRAWEKGDQRGVTVEGDAVAVVPLLPGMSFKITSTFGGPIECFRPDDGSEGCE
ncbi:TadE/TadG family type IV pilus assembly protein [Sphaerisporangium corydalis]|uniref:TadE/TadG family type IV pilus assembly protein n=1 Tax=Sphaerisporangium corydalis TaxID=1441875 RepID=A0ABV9EBK6_9ACTN|nr:TadE family protein [Sphaerisporangium corydalis]